jgi:hypothetical protein
MARAELYSHHVTGRRTSMISSKSKGGHDPSALRLDLEQFEVLFQVTKEFRSLPDLLLTAIGVGSKDIDRLLELVRSISATIEGASRIQLDIYLDEVAASRPPMLIRKSAESQASVTIHGSITDRLLAAWGRLSEAAISSLGSRELFLRTGYDESEIRQVTVRLNRTSPDLS